MQEGEGKGTRKSDEIAPTPPRGHLAEVTPRPMVNKRAQAKAKKKGLEGYFGTGARVPPPCWRSLLSILVLMLTLVSAGRPGRGTVSV